MSHVVLRLVRLSIYVDSVDEALCREPSSDARVDGCACFTRDGDGDAYCGAFGWYLVLADDEEFDDEQARYKRAPMCLSAQIQNGP